MLHSLLHLAELDAHDELALGRHALEHVGLEAAQQVRPEQVVQPLHLLLLTDVRELVQERLRVTASTDEPVIRFSKPLFLFLNSNQPKFCFSRGKFECGEIQMG